MSKTFLPHGFHWIWKKSSGLRHIDMILSGTISHSSSYISKNNMQVIIRFAMEGWVNDVTLALKRLLERQSLTQMLCIVLYENHYCGFLSRLWLPASKVNILEEHFFCFALGTYSEANNHVNGCTAAWHFTTGTPPQENSFTFAKESLVVLYIFQM